jgi:hypothetical protein
MTEVTEAQEVQVHVSPIKLAEEAGCRPQMIYTYIKKGYIDSVIVDGKIRVPVEGDKGSAAWLEKYVTRKAELAEARAAKVEQELAGQS